VRKQAKFTDILLYNDSRLSNGLPTLSLCCWSTRESAGSREAASSALKTRSKESDSYTGCSSHTYLLSLMLRSNPSAARQASSGTDSTTATKASRLRERTHLTREPRDGCTARQDGAKAALHVRQYKLRNLRSHQSVATAIHHSASSVDCQDSAVNLSNLQWSRLSSKSVSLVGY
jgi:hypothetical protein